MLKEVKAVRGGEGVQGLAQSVKQAIERALGGLAQSGFQFGEGHFDGVEVGAVGRKVKQGGSGGSDGLGDAFDFMGGEVIADDHITWGEFGRKNFAQVSQEGRTVHRAIQEPGSSQPVITQGRDEGGTLPVAMRHGGQTALAAFAAPIETAHLGVEPGLIQKDQSPVIPGPALFPPVLPGQLKLWPILLGGAQRFF